LATIPALATLDIRNLRTLHVGPVSFAVEPGECVSLWGPSGAGKSLLLRACADLDPHEGEVSLDTTPQSSISGPDWRRQVGYLPSESAWWEATVGEHMTVDADALAALGFGADVLDWEVARLSSGERQRLALLRLLAGAPRALLLDEPTANLDPDATEAVEGLLARYAAEHAAPLLWVSHDAEQRQRVAARSLRIVNGRLEG
jgi:ABC-type iron transport system FetAB ATPase subunit